MNVADTLRAAAHALSDWADLVHAPALAGLLQNRADDMERNIALWRRAGQDVPFWWTSTTACTSPLPKLFFSIPVTVLIALRHFHR
jgi:hypothetical protein